MEMRDNCERGIPGAKGRHPGTDSSVEALHFSLHTRISWEPVSSLISIVMFVFVDTVEDK